MSSDLPATANCLLPYDHLIWIYLTSTIGNVHNISIKSGPFNSSDTVAMGVAANLGAKHEKKCRRKSTGDKICFLPTLIHKQTPSSYDCDVRIIIVRLILSYLIIKGPTFDKVGFRKGWIHASLMQVNGVRLWFAIGCAWYRLIFLLLFIHKAPLPITNPNLW